ncbi:MAG: DUF1036 domain-containing protein [Hyphomicrobiales bacterium]|nr:DUF1036 domain-containing protein [Hyphomicrobiales bacterium]
MARSILRTVAVAATCLASTTAARAEITYCNSFGRLIYIAIAYPQSNGTFISRGWMSLDKGKCSIFDTALRVKTFYYHAESSWVRTGRRRSREVWGKGQKFAIWDNSNFQYYNAQNRVLRSTLVEFTQGPVADDGDVSATVTFSSGSSTVSTK